ncbi:MAG: replication initiator protein [Microviridae sp.]|nr:MAG: replication initiator protein [Microviridae sp.]
MACTSPIRVSKGRSSELFGFLDLPCGYCKSCLLERSRQWSVRIMHEASLWTVNSFVTLTYDDAFVPDRLDYSHFQGFMRSLRRTRSRVRFFMCGEYGSLTNRPHFHACLFNVGFDDGLPVCVGAAGDTVFESAELSKHWKFGFSSYGELSHRSAAYVARYSLKKSPGSDCFVHMSLKPGIGRGWLDKFKSDVYPHDRVIVNGKARKPPKYYDNVMYADSSFDSVEFKHLRAKRARLRLVDSTYDRLGVIAHCVDSRLSQLKRSL